MPLEERLEVPLVRRFQEVRGSRGIRFSGGSRNLDGKGFGGSNEYAACSCKGAELHERYCLQRLGGFKGFRRHGRCMEGSLTPDFSLVKLL